MPKYHSQGYKTVQTSSKTRDKKKRYSAKTEWFNDRQTTGDVKLRNTTSTTSLIE